MNPDDLWHAAMKQLRTQDGPRPFTAMLGKSPSERTRFDFHGHAAEFYWGGGNIVCINIAVGDVEVSLSKPTSWPARWRGTPPDSALVDLALRAGLENNFTN